MVHVKGHKVPKHGKVAGYWVKPHERKKARK